MDRIRFGETVPDSCRNQTAENSPNLDPIPLYKSTDDHAIVAWPMPFSRVRTLQQHSLPHRRSSSVSRPRTDGRGLVCQMTQ